MKTISTIFTAAKNILLWLLKKACQLFVYLACAMSTVKFLVGVLLEPTKDTTALTNVGFAMFIAVSSVLFAWSRSLNEKTFPRQVHTLNRSAAISILGSICFVFLSLFKYIIINPNDKYLWYLQKSSSFDIMFLQAASLVCVLGVMMALMFIVVPTFRVFIELWDDLYSHVLFNPPKSKEDRRTEL